MSSLRRTRAGRFTLEQAVTMEQILAFAQEHDPAELLMPVDALFAQHPALIVTLGQTEKLKHGAAIRDWHFADGTYRVYSEDRRIFAAWHGQRADFDDGQGAFLRYEGNRNARDRAWVF